MFLAIGRIFLAFLTVCAFTGAIHAATIYTLDRGNPDRKAVLDTIRPVIEVQLNGPVEFVVDRIVSSDGIWAFAVLNPQRPGGAPIDPAKTRLAADIDFLDGLTTYALVRHQNGRWNLISYVIGPTDVAWTGWPDQFGAPPVLFGFSE